MIKKQIRLFAIAFFLIQSTLHAQVRFGVLAGPHSASVFETNNIPDWFTVRDGYTSRFSFHGGVIADMPFSGKSPLHFQPSIIYSGKGRKFEPPSSIIALYYVKQEQFVNYIDIPLNLVLKFPVSKNSRFIVGGGPQLSFLIGGKETTKIKEGDTAVNASNKLEKGSGPGQYKGFDFSLNALVGFEFGRFFVTVNYARSFGDFYTAKYDPFYSGKFRNNVIGGTLGVFFGRQKDAKPRDRDKDGIPDDLDQCPTQAGTSITNGCPDKDADGVADKNDNCPDQSGPLSNKGCPIPDKDGDSVPDDQDKCPDVAGLQIYDGCPIPDKDNDGVNDFEDRCPTVPGSAANRGCPIADADKDGIPDKDDKCPDQPGPASNKGCPVPDTDGDGLKDDVDKCPEIKGTKENGGCPEVKKEVIDKLISVSEQIKFVAQKADLQAASYKILDQAIKLLKQNPSLSITIETYTNVLKTTDANQKLATERANNVMAYIGLQGIDWSRMKANGFATDIPATVDPQAKNSGNRTEIKVIH